MDAGSACSCCGCLGVKSMREVSYVSFSHDFHPQEAAAAACRPHIMLSTFCDLQLLCAEHPHPLKVSGAPDHHCYANTKCPDQVNAGHLGGRSPRQNTSSGHLDTLQLTFGEHEMIATSFCGTTPKCQVSNARPLRLA